jgi:PKD repeat protein
MSSILNKHTFSICAAIAATVSISSCKYDVKELGPEPDASFTVTPVAGQSNRYALASTSQNAFRYSWDRGDGKGYVNGTDKDTVFYPLKGNYNVKLLVYGQSGIDTVTQTIAVANDIPPIEMLSGGSSKTWVLAPEPSALVIGPNASDVWWSNTQADVTDSKRTCLFNDEYTFNMNGTFTFNDKGDFRVDDEANAPWPKDIGLAIGCYNTSQIPAKYQAWGSGNHTFTVSNTQLKVMGTGAHMGLYKVGENGTSEAPESAITYEVLELSPTKLVIRKAYSWGQWKFTFRPK